MNHQSALPFSFFGALLLLSSFLHVSSFLHAETPLPPSVLGKWTAPSWDGAQIRTDGTTLHVTNPADPGKRVQITTQTPEIALTLNPRLEKDCLVLDASRLTGPGPENLKLIYYSLPEDQVGEEYFTLRTEIQGPNGGSGRLFFEGRTKENAHFFRELKIHLNGRRQIFENEELLPNDLAWLTLRFDFVHPGEYRFYGTTVTNSALLEPDPETANQPAELIFSLPFDGNAEPAQAAGEKKPLAEKGVTYVPGLKGQAAQFSQKNAPVLKFAREGNLCEERGTISAWVRLDGEVPAGWRMILSEPWQDATRIGSGAIWYWVYEGALRGDVSDIYDRYIVRPMPRDGAWHHVVFTWDEFNHKSLYIDGDRKSILERKGNLAQPTKPGSFNRTPYSEFFVGSYLGRALNGAMDELKIYSGPLSQDEVTALFHEFRSIAYKPRTRYFFEDEPLKLDGTLSNFAQVEQALTVRVKEQTPQDAGPKVLFEQKLTAQPGEKALDLTLPKQKPGVYRIEFYDLEDRLICTFPVWIFHASNTTGQSLSSARTTTGQLWSEDLKLKLIAEIDPTQAFREGPAGEHYSQVGEAHVAELNGVKYLETAPAAGDRFALRVHFPEPKGKCFAVEYDFPDDKCRSADILLQPVKADQNDYDLQVGYVTGDEYPNSGQMMTQRYLIYPRGEDYTLIVMSARTMEAGAALAKLRVYEVEGPLPIAQISPAKPRDGWTRPVGIYFEDPAVGYDFGNFGYSPENFESMLDRLCAYMKYSGQSMFSYPFVWYDGVIGDRYNPRNHPPRPAEAFAKKFDREGLDFMVTFNQNNISFECPAVTRADIQKGRLYDSIFTIHNTGTPHPGGWHDSPPIFNILHPDVQKMVLQEVDEILDICADHPSFRGIVLHLPMHSLNSLGDIRTGYNDYMIRDFEKETGITVDVDKKDPKRGKLYYEWLMKNAREEWVDWRCRKLSAWYKTLAKRLTDRRPDLKLGIHAITPILYARTVYDDVEGLRDFWGQVNRDMGIDAKYLADDPAIFVEQSVFPADYRWMHGRSRPEIRERLRLTEESRGMYASLLDAPNAWVHHFDRYWESAIARDETRNGKPNQFPSPWLKECTWRVTTLNPSGIQAMKHYVMPLRYKDVLGISKGGFLIGSYGMEPELIAFAQAFRALPAVEFSDVKGSTETVKIRRWSDGKSTWFYAVNTTLDPVTVTIAKPGTVLDLARNVKIKYEGDAKIKLGPYALRSFQVPGDVEIVVK